MQNRDDCVLISRKRDTNKLSSVEKRTMFCLVRHGSTDFNTENRLQGWVDTSLNDAGMIQAKELAFSMKEQHWDIVISSDLMRARQTAEVISDLIDIPLFSFKGLRERNFGIYEGMLIHEVEKMKLMSGKSNEKGEEKDKFLLRIKKSFDTLANLFEGYKIIVVSHGGVLTNFLKHNVGYCKEVWGNTEFVIVSFYNGNWKVCND